VSNLNICSSSSQVSQVQSSVSSSLSTSPNEADVRATLTKKVEQLFVAICGAAKEKVPESIMGDIQKMPAKVIRILAKAACETLDLQAGAVCLLAQMYEQGDGLPQDFNKALKCYTISANCKNTPALFALGQFYVEGEQVKKDLHKALGYLKLAADLGEPEAAYEIGVLYENEIEIMDLNKAATYYKRGADLGDDVAQCSIADFYLEGKGVKKDLLEAEKYLQRAAYQESAMGLINLGDFYFEGKGGKKDPEKAVACYQQAADQEDPEAEYKFAKCLESGIGVQKKDSSKAAEYYKRAALHGYVDENTEG
jgi:TPR repeat protein